MKKTFFVLLLSVITFQAWCQNQKKPTLMLLPSDHWCSSRFFTKQYDVQGKTVIINDYESCFREDSELPLVLTKVGELLGKDGYQLKNYMMEMRSMSDRKAEEEVTMSSSGMTMQETPIDAIRRRAKHDIEIAVDWAVAKSGGRHVVSFSIDAIDTYTSMVIASVNGTGKPTNEPIVVALPMAIEPRIKKFESLLDKYFADLHQNGREITLSVNVWDGSDINLETEFNGNELIEIIEEWVADNSVKASYNMSEATESRASFERVRIPFLNDKGNPLDARAFTSSLRKYLKGEPYLIDSKVMMRGLGEASIIIGGK